MDINKFLSKATYLALPTPSRPKVYLCISNGAVAKTSFALYNPFSSKAKILKRLTQFLCVHCNSVAKKMVPTTKGEKSDFMEFLENSTASHLISSVYIATAKDKIVLQLQDKSNVIGYLKYPLSELGEKRLINERNAISILAKKAIVPELIQQDTFDGMPYIIVKNLEGDISQLQNDKYQIVLDRLKKDKKYKLAQHPRIRQIANNLETFEMTLLSQILNATVQLSYDEYFEVFEHGDFAPWNLIQTQNNIIPFDFEYFEEIGLEYLDEIKYHFQVQHLLAGKVGINLVEAIVRQLNFSEASLMFRIFLLKEIVNKLESGETYDFEQSLLQLIIDKK